jgi:putative phosphoribosyl transferase
LGQLLGREHVEHPREAGIAGAERRVVGAEVAHGALHLARGPGKWAHVRRDVAERVPELVEDQVTGVVAFSHGSGSSRHSPRNRYVADVLGHAGLGTLLLDLLTPEEERDRANVFDIGLLAARLTAATGWLRSRSDTRAARIGYFGASTGAAAALLAAAEPDSQVAAVVSRGGRPDLAGPHLSAVRAPTLLIVGGNDDAVLELNRRAQAELRCTSRLEVVPGASHLFEESGTLAKAAILARDWFCDYLLTPRTQSAASVPR